jgi:eukaryotic-like serine/threonine-protein kinase
MRPGEVIDGRFELDRLVGSGGMGEVYRALDRASGEPVAIKVLFDEPNAVAARFMREAEVLAELHHPGIVRYVAHGGTATDQPYLAMEWLDGEDLGRRLQRERLTVKECVALMARAVEALSAVHAHGIIHRDLKPSNLFLVEGNIGRVKLLDFGIARLHQATRMTKTGVLLGTPGYMAPEQARNGQNIDARADVFALGCVLFECLTGQPAFSGEHFMAILAKILLAEVPRVREIRPEVPPALDALCAWMLAKDPEARPHDGAAVEAALEAAGIAATLPAASVPAASGSLSSALTRKERRVLSVVLMGPEPSLEPGAEPLNDEGQIVATPEEMQEDVATRGGHVELLVDGSIMASFVATGIATDQAMLATRAALAMRALSGARPMALATGRAEMAGKLPIGVVIDRAAQMLSQLEFTLRAVPVAWRAAPIAIDEVTAGLLDARFEVIETDTGLLLRREQALAEDARTLLGKPTACVGRDWELSMLEQLFSECTEESRGRAVLVTAAAGMGKSRLAYEFLLRARQRGEPLEVWVGRGDPLGASTAFGLLGQALQGACGIRHGEPLSVRRNKVLTRVAEHVPLSEVRRVSEFLGEILGTPFPDGESEALRAARGDAQIMGDQIRKAWVEFLSAAASARPVLLLLEDLHSSDQATVKLIDDALRWLKLKPWMVLALARPEVHELFPRLWAERSIQEIRLKELSLKASARLVRQVLGDRVSTETLDRLLARADGNAFYLEELIRATAEQREDALPETVLSMVQSRVEGIESAARLLLRAASVFGEVFWRGAVTALLGGGSSELALDDHLARLERLEWIAARPETKFQGQQEFAFRHTLVREAAYGMLTDEDRALGHRLAAEWLEQVGEPSAAVIAEHFDRGGDRARAAQFYQRAAAQALAASDLEAAEAHTARAQAVLMSGEAEGELDGRRQG